MRLIRSLAVTAANSLRGGRGEEVRAFRLCHGLTSEELARMLDIEPIDVRRYERGAAPPWMKYALIGLEYGLSGVVSERGDGTGAQALS